MKRKIDEETKESIKTTIVVFVLLAMIFLSGYGLYKSWFGDKNVNYEDIKPKFELIQEECELYGLIHYDEESNNHTYMECLVKTKTYYNKNSVGFKKYETNKSIPVVIGNPDIHKPMRNFGE